MAIVPNEHSKTNGKLAHLRSSFFAMLILAKVFFGMVGRSWTEAGGSGRGGGNFFSKRRENLDASGYSLLRRFPFFFLL